MLPSVKKIGVIALLGGALALVTVTHAQTTVTAPRTTTNTFGANSNIRVGPGILLNDNRFNPMGSNPYGQNAATSATCYGYCPTGSYSGGCYGSGYGYGGGYAG